MRIFLSTWNAALFAYAVFCFVAACSSPPSTAEVAGDYEAQYAYGVERISLRNDGSYEQVLTIASTGETVSHRGTWSYIHEKTMVIVNDPLLFDDNFGKLNSTFRTPVSGEWRLDVRKRNGKIVLAWNDDLGIHFRRVR